MLALTDKILLNYFKWRQRKIESVMNNPLAAQMAILDRITEQMSSTQYGLDCGMCDSLDYASFSDKIPVVEYEDIFSYIERMMDGADNILCKGRIKWFAKSSGTSTGRSKYIPVSKDYLVNGHLKCAWDAASFIYNEDPEARLFADKSLIMGGSVERLTSGVYCGDISGIIIKHFPGIGKRFYTPDFETALMSDWDMKMKKMAAITSKENVTLVAGVPTWLSVLFDHILELTGAADMSEIWPGLRSFLHGGVDFGPYRQQFRQYLPSTDIRYREVYNASEGYFAIQNKAKEEGMLLLCDHEIFYEFIEWPAYKSGLRKCLHSGQLESGGIYVLVISNTSGLLRYIPGDLIRVVCTAPLKIKVCGRTRAMINVFGEELSIGNVEEAITRSCEKFNCQIRHYTVGPRFLERSVKGGHDWVIEFENPPGQLVAFQTFLDDTLRSINSDYDAKRSANLALECLQVIPVPARTFESWMRSRGSYGGQNKIPRLRNDRQIIEELLSVG